MGGAAGHICHPFELESVKTGQDLLDFFSVLAKKLFSGEISGHIKYDGANLSVKVVNRTGKRQFAIDRGTNKALDVNGVTISDIDSRFENEEAAQAAKILLMILNAAFPYVQKHLRALGLLNDPTRFLNLDYVGRRQNAIDYGKCFLAFHNVGQFYQKEPKVVSADTISRPGLIREAGNNAISKQIAFDNLMLNQFVEEIRPFAAQFGFDVVGPTLVKPIKELSEDIFPSLKSQITINYSKYEPKFATLEEWLSNLVIPKDIKVQTADKKLKSALTKAFYRELLAPKQGQKPKSAAEIVTDATERLAVMDGALTWHATRLLGSDLLKHLGTDSGNLDNHEGIVVALDDLKPVKITGDFIVYGEDQSKFATDKSEIPLLEQFFPDMAEREEHHETKNFHVVFIPGGFKPPTIAHIDTIRQYAEVADRVFLVMADNSRKIRDGWEVSLDQTRKIIELYAEVLPNNPFASQKVHYITIGEHENPIGMVIDMLAGHKMINIDGVQAPEHFENESEEKLWKRREKFAKFFNDIQSLSASEIIEVSVGASSKGNDMQRSFNIVSYFHNNPHLLPDRVRVTYPPISPPPFRVHGKIVTASDMREALSNCNREEVRKFLPIDDDGLLDKVLDILEFGKHCGNMESSVVIESSGAAGGGVEGFVSPFTSGDKSSEEKKKKMNKKYGLTPLQEERLRRIIQHIITEAKSKEQPVYSSTAMNFLHELMDNIKPKIEAGYKKLSSSGKQRKSYITHILHSIANDLEQMSMNARAADNDQAGSAEELAEALLKFEREGDFLLVSEEVVKGIVEATEEEMAAEQEAQAQEQANQKVFADKEQEPEQPKQDAEEVAFEKFKQELPNEDATGAKVAYDVFSEIRSPILNSLENLTDPKDKTEFINYLYANVVAMTVKWEDEMPAPDQGLQQYLQTLAQQTEQSAQSAEQPSDMPIEEAVGAGSQRAIDIKKIIASVDPTYKPQTPAKPGDESLVVAPSPQPKQPQPAPQPAPAAPPRGPGGPPKGPVAPKRSTPQKPINPPKTRSPL